jgi:hypothetical protein
MCPDPGGPKVNGDPTVDTRGADIVKALPAALATLTTTALAAAVLCGPPAAAVSAAEHTDARVTKHTGNLIRNGSAETTSPKPSSDGEAKVAIAHWKVTKQDQFTAVRYGTPEFPLAKDGATKGGRNFFAGGSHGTRSSASQKVSLTSYAGWVKAGAHFTLSGWLGGFESQKDRAVVKITWLNAHGKRTGSASIGPVTVSDRGGRTELLKRSTRGKVPAHTASARVVITASHADGTYVDGYADRLSLVLAKG